MWEACEQSIWFESPQHHVEKCHVIISNGLIKLNPKIESERDKAYKYPLFYSHSHTLLSFFLSKTFLKQNKALSLKNTNTPIDSESTCKGEKKTLIFILKCLILVERIKQGLQTLEVSFLPSSTDWEVL